MVQINKEYVKIAKLIWIFGLLPVLSILGVVGFSIALYNKSSITKFTYCITLNNENVQLGEAGNQLATGFGYLEIDTDTNNLKYDVVFMNLDVPTSITIRGPTSEGDITKGAVFLPKNGNTLDMHLTQSNRIQGSQRIDNKSMRLIISNPHLYYVLVTTSAYPNGAVGDRLMTTCKRN